MFVCFNGMARRIFIVYLFVFVCVAKRNPIGHYTKICFLGFRRTLMPISDMINRIIATAKTIEPKKELMEMI